MYLECRSMPCTSYRPLSSRRSLKAFPMKPSTPRISTRFFWAARIRSLARFPKPMPSTRPISAASCAPPMNTSPSRWPASTRRDPVLQAITSGSTESTVPGLASSSRETSVTAQKRHFRSPMWLKAPGKGRVTARTRFLTLNAGMAQSISPSAGVRPP